MADTAECSQKNTRHTQGQYHDEASAGWGTNRGVLEAVEGKLASSPISGKALRRLLAQKEIASLATRYALPSQGTERGPCTSSFT